LTPDQLAFIEEIPLRATPHWEELKSVIEYINTADFSNLNRILNPEMALSSAKA
jgi:hypothetical protein